MDQFRITVTDYGEGALNTLSSGPLLPGLRFQFLHPDFRADRTANRFCHAQKLKPTARQNPAPKARDVACPLKRRADGAELEA
jgi:hypothetical protein